MQIDSLQANYNGCSGRFFVYLESVDEAFLQAHGEGQCKWTLHVHDSVVGGIVVLQLGDVSNLSDDSMALGASHSGDCWNIFPRANVVLHRMV